MSSGLDQVLKAKNYFDLLFDKTCGDPLKKQILKLCPKFVIEIIEEIFLNIKFDKIPLNPQTDALLEENKKHIRILVDISIPINKKREYLLSSQGLRFLLTVFPSVLWELEQSHSSLTPWRDSRL